jgi:predicted MFS family arabinose efflux permease
LTKSYPVFLALSCIAAITTVTPQLMLPLVGELAPAHRRATALSIVVSGLLLGMLIARLLSGILTQYTTWRSIYWFSLGVQYLIFALLFLFMPDYPSANPDGIHYFRILSSILMLLLRSPVLVQACLIGFFTSSIFTSYWTTLTFLLASPPYSYPPVIIALFALLGISAMLLAPLYSRHITDRFIPHLTILLGLLYVLIGTIIGTYARPHSTVAGPIIQALLMDLGLQTAQIANRANIYAIDPRARNRLNTAYMVAAFSGQLTGTAAGNRLYAAGGWVRSGSASVGFVCAALVVWAARGPWEKGWVGWGGGWSVRRRDVGERTSGQGGSQGGDVESSPPPAMDKEEEKEEKNAQS